MPADPLGRVVAFGLAMKRVVLPESLGDSHHFLAQQPQLLGDGLVLHGSGICKRAGRQRHRDHEGDSPMHAACRAILQVGSERGRIWPLGAVGNALSRRVLVDHSARE